MTLPILSSQVPDNSGTKHLEVEILNRFFGRSCLRQSLPQNDKTLILFYRVLDKSLNPMILDPLILFRKPFKIHRGKK